MSTRLFVLDPITLLAHCYLGHIQIGKLGDALFFSSCSREIFADAAGEGRRLFRAAIAPRYEPQKFDLIWRAACQAIEYAVEDGRWIDAQVLRGVVLIDIHRLLLREGYLHGLYAGPDAEARLLGEGLTPAELDDRVTTLYNYSSTRSRRPIEPIPVIVIRPASDMLPPLLRLLVTA